MTLFIFEGLPGTGKTKLIRDLSKDLKANRVGEIIDKNFKEILPSEVGKVRQNFFFYSDKRKYLVAKRYAYRGTTLMDRGYLSTIAYNLCLNKRIKKLCEIEKKLDKIYSKGNVYIYIRISPEISISRKNKIPNDSNDAWSFPDNLYRIYKFYEDRLCSKEDLFIVDGSLPYKEVYKRIKSFIVDYEKEKRTPEHRSQ